MKLPVKTVETRLYRARKLLRTGIEIEGGSAQHGFGAQNTPKITDTFTGAGSEFRGLFKSINDLLLKFKGVAKNEL